MTTEYLDVTFREDFTDGFYTFPRGTRLSLPGPAARAIGNRLTINGPGVVANSPIPGTSFNGSQFALANQVHRAGYRVLVCWASTGARPNNSYGLRQNTYARDNAGNVTFWTGPFADAYPGKVVKVTSAQNAWLIAFVRITAVATDGGSGDTIITGTELYTAPRRAVVANTVLVGDGTMFCHDLSQSQDAHSWQQKLNVRCGGMLEFYNLSSGGTQCDDWQDLELRAYIASMVASIGYFDFGLFNFGTGNAFTFPTYTSQQIAAQLQDNMTYWSQWVREGFLLGEPGARLYGDGALSASPQLTPDFTTMSLVSQFHKRHTTQNQPNLAYIDTAFKANGPSRRGSVNRPDLLLGRTPIDMTDSSGIHWTPAMDDIIAECIAESMLPRIQLLPALSPMQPDTVYDNTVSDAGGALLNPCAMVGPAGAVPTVNLQLNGTGAVLGQTWQGVTATASGVDGSMTLSCEVKDGVRGRREAWLYVSDPTFGGLTLSLLWRGLTGRTFLSILNDAKFRDVDLWQWFDFGLFGFNPNGVYQVDASLIGVSATYGTQCLHSWYSNRGALTMFEAKRAFYRGMTGLHRSNTFRTAVATTYTDAYVLLSITGIQPIVETAVSITGNGTTATVTASPAFLRPFGGEQGFRDFIQVSGATPAGFNMTGTRCTAISETQFTYPCSATGTATGTITLRQSLPMGDLSMYLGDSRLAKDQLL